MINRDTRTIELATQHLCGDGHAEHITSEFDVGLQVIDIRSTFENLDHGTFTTNFEDLTLSELTVSEADIDNFGISIDKLLK